MHYTKNGLCIRFKVSQTGLKVFFFFFFLRAARYVGVKEYVPPYLDPTLTIEDLMTGVSFASAGSGFDPLTPTISVTLSKYSFSKSKGDSNS